MNIALGIDLGTQSVKILAYDTDKKSIVALASSPLDLIVLEDGTREQKTAWYDQALKACFDTLDREIKDSITSIGVSGQQHGLIALDANKQPLYNVKLWNDTSTEQECTELITAIGQEKLISETHNMMLSGFTAPKVLWLKKNYPDLFQQVKYILLPHNYVNFILTDEYFMEASDASGTCFYNPVKQAWSELICNAIDDELIHKLPKIQNSNSICGYTNNASQRRFGIAPGIPVSSGGGDNMMSAIGTNTISHGTMAMSLGTSGTVYGSSDTFVYEPNKGISGFSSATGGYLPLLCTMNCTVITEAVRALLDISLDEFELHAQHAPIGSEGLTVLPYMNGERFPTIPHSHCSFHGIGVTNFTRENLCRAAIESASFTLYEAVESFKELGFTPSNINLTGGGAKNKVWQQIIADITGVPIKIIDIEETAAFGAALQGVWATQGGDIAKIAAQHIAETAIITINPNNEHTIIYKEHYKKFKSLVGTLINNVFAE